MRDTATSGPFKNHRDGAVADTHVPMDCNYAIGYLFSNCYDC